jgi:hypothetical protein
MKEQKKLIEENLPSILADIKSVVLAKYGITGVNVAEISFDQQSGCPPGFTQVCKQFGKDPRTGQPIIKCKCVKIRDGN